MKIKIMFYPEKTKEQIAKGEKQSSMTFVHPKKTRTELTRFACEKLRKMGREEKTELTGINQFKILPEEK